MSSISGRLTIAREARGMSKTQAAKSAHVGYEVLKKYEAGRMPKFDVCMKLCEVYKVSPQWAATGEATTDHEKRLNGLLDVKMKLEEYRKKLEEDGNE